MSESFADGPYELSSDTHRCFRHSLALLADAGHMLSDAGSLRELLNERFGIEHVTVQLEHATADEGLPDCGVDCDP